MINDIRRRNFQPVPQIPIVAEASPVQAPNDKPREESLEQNLAERKTRIRVAMTAHDLLVERGAI